MDTNRICQFCLRCEKPLKKGTYLCKHCRQELALNVEEQQKFKKQYKSIKMERRKRLIKLREVGLKKIVPSQFNATGIAEKIAHIFGYECKRECIKEPYRIDLVIKNGVYRVGIEIDGGIHDKQFGYDEKRDTLLLNKYGVKIYRFKNEDVETDYFKNAIWAICYSMMIERVKKLNEAAKEYDIVIPVELRNI